MLMHTVRGRLQRKLFYTKIYPTKYFQRENFAIYGTSDAYLRSTKYLPPLPPPPPRSEEPRLPYPPPPLGRLPYSEMIMIAIILIHYTKVLIIHIITHNNNSLAQSDIKDYTNSGRVLPITFERWYKITPVLPKVRISCNLYCIVVT